LPEVNLLTDTHAELPEHVRERAHVVIRKQDVQQEQHAEGDVEVERDELLDVGPQDLHCDALAVQCRTDHLPDRRSGERRALEAVEHLIDGATQLRRQHGLDALEGIGRDPVLKRADRRQVWLWKDVSTRGEHLRELDERGTESGDGPGQTCGPSRVVLIAATGGTAEEDEAAAIAEEGDDERRQSADDLPSAPPPVHETSVVSTAGELLDPSGYAGACDGREFPGSAPSGVAAPADRMNVNA